MKKLAAFLFTVIIALGAGYVGASLHKGAGETAVTETALDRVLRTKTLRCGYAMWPPSVLMKDPNTGAMTGFAADIINAIAAKNSLKVEWTAEVGWNDYPEALVSGRFDMFCSLAWMRGEMGARLLYSHPVAYSALQFYTRADDHRFDNNLTILNDPAYKLSVMDGEISQRHVNRVYPKAGQVAVGSVGDITQIFLNVATGKADGVFNEASLARGFADKNPGTIRQVTTEPVAVYPDLFPMAGGEFGLQAMVNTALLEMHNFGEIDKFIDAYETDRSAFMPVAKPFNYVPPAALK